MIGSVTRRPIPPHPHQSRDPRPMARTRWIVLIVLLIYGEHLFVVSAQSVVCPNLLPRAGFYCPIPWADVVPCPAGLHRKCPMARIVCMYVCMCVCVVPRVSRSQVCMHPGFFCPAGSTTPRSCPANHMCPSGAAAPVPCPPGYKARATSAACSTDVPDGTRCVHSGGL
jgi:hypothetical protein